MSKKDNVKSHIDTLRVMLVAFITAIFGIFGYVIIHIDGGVVALILLCACLTLTIRQYLKLSKKLEKMK